MKRKRPKNKRNAWIIDESKCLGMDEVKQLKRFCNKSKNDGLNNKKFVPVRNWYMIELGLNAGLRVEEMATLKYRNLIISGSKSSIVVTGKGNKKRSIKISSDFKKACQTYLKYKSRFGYDISEESYLLNNLKGQKITKRALQKFFKIILEKAGLSSHYYIHCLRHTYSTFLLTASNHNYRFVQSQLGHSSITTTQIYASVIDSEGKKAVEKMYK